MTCFAFLNALRLERLIEGALATVGAFLVGYVIAILVGWWFDKYLIKRKSPEFLHKVCRFLSGLAFAIIVALMLLGGGGGEGNGEGDGKGSGKASPTEGTAVEPADPLLITTKAALPVENRIRITILGGSDVQGQKFYLVDDDRTPLAFEDLKSQILKRRDSTARISGLEIQFPRRNALPQDHLAVTQLTRWASEVAGLTITFPAGTP